MHRTKGNLCILIARLTQIVLGLVVLVTSVVLTVGELDPYSENIASEVTDSLRFASIFLGAGIVLFGTFSLFGLKHLPDDAREIQTLNLLILFIDLWAIVLCIAAGVCMIIDTNTYGWYNERATTVAPAVCAILCVFAILIPVVRTLRIWWKRMLHTVPPGDTMFIDEYACKQHYYCTHHHGPAFAPSQPQPGRPTYQAHEIKSSPSSRPQSALSDQTLTHYPNILSATHTSPPTRAPSHATALPPYSGRVEIGSKI